MLTKDDIRAHFPYGLVPQGLDLDGALARREVSFVRTSGTADEALENLWDQQWRDASERASWKLNSIAERVATGTHREAILASALSVGPRSEQESIGRDRRMLGRYLFLNEFGTTGEWPEGHERRILGELADYRPAVLEANPSLLGLDLSIPFNPVFESCIANLSALRIRRELLTAEEIHRRFPVFRVADKTIGLYQADAGILPASQCVRVLSDRAIHYGAAVIDRSPVRSIQLDDDGADVETDQATYRCRKLIICAGPWAGPLLASEASRTW